MRNVEFEFGMRKDRVRGSGARVKGKAANEHPLSPPQSFTLSKP